MSIKAFVVMPFADAFNDVYDAIRLSVEHAAAGEEVRCFRLSELKSAGRITDRLVKELSEAAVCIADITGLNANVMWEVGYAMALGKPTLLISQVGFELPFDLGDMHTVVYKRDDLAQTLRKPLAEAFRQTLGAFNIRTAGVQRAIRPKGQTTIAVTGSMEAPKGRVIRRAEVLLTPFLSDQTLWLVGSWGNADEAVIEFLNQQGQRITIVGYNSSDISARVLALAEQHDIPFLPADQERLPAGLHASSDRDAYFLARADLTVFLWDGKSSGIGEMLTAFRSQKVNHVVGFI
jgi:hypothetical protein